MNCQITGTAAVRMWPAILALKEALGAIDDDVHVIHMAEAARTWKVIDDASSPPEASVMLTISLDQADPLVTCVAGTLGADELAFLRLYTPIVFGAHRARLAGALFITGHLAQTLDGRIACNTGHSQWIGNEADLHHAHRLRALHDAILVGGRTVETDDPQLTVRHVPGPSPRRFVLSGRGRAWRTRPDAGIFRAPGCVLLCAASARLDLPPVPDCVTISELPSDDGRIRPRDAAAAVAASGATSLFVEGGGVTLSSFLGARLLDVLHIHVAPRILGSGVSGFSLPEVETIGEGAQVHMTHYELDGELLFECRCPSGAPVPPSFDPVRR